MSRKHMLVGQIKSAHVKDRYSFRIPAYLYDFVELSVVQSKRKISRNAWISAAIVDFHKHHVLTYLVLHEKYPLQKKIDNSNCQINEALAILFSATYIPHSDTKQLPFKFRKYDQGKDALQNLLSRLYQVRGSDRLSSEELIKKAVTLAILEKLMSYSI